MKIAVRLRPSDLIQVVADQSRRIDSLESTVENLQEEREEVFAAIRQLKSEMNHLVKKQASADKKQWTSLSEISD